MSVSEDAILKALRRVKGPDLEGNIVDLGLVGPPMIRDGKVYVSVTIDPARADELEPLRQAVEKVLAGVEGVDKATAVLTADRPSDGAGAPATQAQQAPTPKSPMAQSTAASGEHPKVTAAREARAQTAAAAGAGPAKGPPPNPSTQKSDRPQAAGIPGVKHLIAVASGKGGVGKSTTTVNLALALQQNGLKVGILDADVFGPSQPRLLGLSGRPQVAHGNVLRPMEAYGIKAMSIGFLVDEAAPIIFRGPMVSSALQQMMRDVAWGELDVIVIDMPPGTGDVQLTMSQNVPLTGAVIVSTPQDLALIDARKGLNMFRKVDVPVLGIVENMSTFICPKCGERSDIFGHGGARDEAEKLGVPFLGGVPLHMDIRARSDLGQPIVVTDPDGPHAKVYRDIADAMWSQVETAAADRQTAPVLTIANDRKSLVVTFEDATSFMLSAEMLRVMSPSAEVQGHSPEQRVTVGGKRNVAIRELRPVGNYAVRIVFDDGHDSGLFSWDYLKTLNAERDTRWAAYEEELNEKGLTRG